MGFGFGQRRGGELPVELTGFVGRTEEIALIRAELARSRLVTLAGPGGVGKSRTAMRAAAGLTARFPDGVWLAELSGLRDPELLLTSLAAVLELPEQPGMGTLDAMVAHLRERRLLIVLDTCEHLLDACAMLSDVLLREAPGVSVLATSRQPLDVPGERCLTIAPLGPPTRWSCSCSARLPWCRASRSPTPTASSCSRSSAGSTGCRWRWSWRRCGCGRCRSRSWPAGSTAASRC